MPETPAPIYLSLPEGPDGWAETVISAFASHGPQPLTRADCEPSAAWPDGLRQTLAASSALLTIMPPHGLDRLQLRDQAVLATLPDTPARPRNLLVLPDNHPLPAALAFPRPWLTLSDPNALEDLPAAARRQLTTPPPRHAPASDQCPYPGVRSFTAAEGALLFGRQRALKQLANRLDTHSMVIVCGPAGIGKRSLIQAGLFPQRRSPVGDGPWECVSVDPGDAPFHALSRSLLPLLHPGLEASQHHAASDDLGNQLQSGAIGLHSLVTQLLQTQHGSSGLLLHLRGCETLTTQTDIDSARQFLALLQAACEASPLKVVASLDSAFEGQSLQALPELAAHAGWLPLGGFSAAELSEVITRPAHLAGLSVDQQLIDSISADGAAHGIHPTQLGCALQQTWLRRTDDTLSEAAYHAGGRLEQCLEQRANSVWPGLSQEQQQQLQQRWENRTQPAGATGGGPVWSRMGSWDAQARGFRQWHQSLQAALAAWQAGGRATDGLLHGPDQLEADAWLQRSGPKLDHDEREFIRAGQRPPPRAVRSRRSRRREILLAGALVTALVGLAVSSSQWWLATRHRDLQTGTKPPLQAAPQPTEPAPYAAPPSTTSVAVLTDIAEPKVLLIPGDRPGDIAFSSDGQFLLTGSNNGSINLWELASGESRQQFLSGNHNIAALRFFAQDRQFFSVSTNGAVNTWRLPTHKPVLLHPAARSRLTVVATNDRGTRLLTADSAQKVKIFDLVDQQPAKQLSGHRADVIAAAFSADGTRLVTGDEEGNIWLWDAEALTPIRELRAHRSFIDNLRFDPSGDRFLSAGGDGHIRLWDGHDGEPLLDINATDGRIHAAHFSPSARTVASSSPDGIITLWDSNSGAAVATLIGHNGAVRALAFSPDGHWLASTGTDRSVRLWDLSTGHARILRKDSPVQLDRVRFGPKGRWLAVTGNSSTLLLWSLKGAQ